MTCLQVELILALLLDKPQIRSQRCLGDRLGIVVIVLLPLHERLDVDCRNDPRLVPQRAQHPADKMRAQASFHADDARRQLFEDVAETQSLDPPSEGNLSVGSDADEVKYVLADVDADDRKWRRRRFCLWLHAASPVRRCQPTRLGREGSSRSIPLAEVSASLHRPAPALHLAPDLLIVRRTMGFDLRLAVCGQRLRQHDREIGQVRCTATAEVHLGEVRAASFGLARRAPRRFGRQLGRLRSIILAPAPR